MKIEESPRISEFYKLVLDNLKDAVIFCNPIGICTYANKAAERLTGYKTEEMIGKNPRKIILRKYWPLCEKMNLIAALRGKTPVFEVEIKRKDGKIIPVETYGKILKHGSKIAGLLIFVRDVSERKKLLERIIAAKRINEEIVKKAPFGVYIINKKGILEYINPAMVRISGAPKKVLLGLNVLRLPTYVKTGVAKKVREGLKGKAFSIGPIEYVSYYGKKRTIRKFIGIPLKNELGKVEKLMVFVEDLTKIKETEEKLRKSEKKFRSIVEEARDGICIIQDKKIKFVNNALARMLGYKKTELIGKDFLDFVPKELRKEIGEIYENRLKGKKVPNMYEARLLKKNGEEIFVEINAFVHEYEGKSADYGFIRDITERKRIEEELRKSEERFRNLFENAVDPILLLDRSGKIILANKKVEELSGYKRKELVGKHFVRTGLLTPKSALITIKNFAARMLGAEIKPYEIEIVTKSRGIIYGEINAAPIKEDGKIIGDLVIIRDITERKRLEEELRKSHEALKKAFEELRELDRKKDEFISMAAHELKTPLAAISGFSQLLKSESIISNKEVREKYLEIIEKETKRLAKLVDDMLDLSRIDLGTIKIEIKRVNLYKLVQRIRDEVENEVKKKGLKLILKLEKDLPIVTTDEDKLHRIILNLVSNAIKYTPKGKITIHALRKNDFIQFCVEDTGIGIPKKYLQKIFERFFQIESPYTRAHKGSGLGLSICKELVKLLGGKIWVESKVGKGSKFFFTIPIKFRKA